MYIRSNEVARAPTSSSGHLRTIPQMEPPQVSFETGGTKDHPEGMIFDFLVGFAFLAAIILYFVGFQKTFDLASSFAQRSIEYIQTNTL